MPWRRRRPLTRERTSRPPGTAASCGLARWPWARWATTTCSSPRPRRSRPSLTRTTWPGRRVSSGASPSTGPCEKDGLTASTTVWPLLSRVVRGTGTTSLPKPRPCRSRRCEGRTVSSSRRSSRRGAPSSRRATCLGQPTSKARSVRLSPWAATPTRSPPSREPFSAPATAPVPCRSSGAAGWVDGRPKSPMPTWCRWP